MQKVIALKKHIVFLFVVLAAISTFLLGFLKFTFDFDQFFPIGDPDLIFYEEFSKEFGTDDNFLLIAVENKETVFKKDFLTRFNAFSLDAEKFKYTKNSSSLTTLFYPLKTSFGYTKIPVVHLNDSLKYHKDWKKIQEDSLFTNTYIDAKGTSLVVAIETEDNLDYDSCLLFLEEVRSSLKKHQLKEYHLLGRAYFYESFVAMQKRELLVTSALSAVLVLLVLFIIYRKIAVVALAFSSIVMALLLFLGLLSILGKELNTLSSFYPILLLIVGSADVIHIMDSYLEKLHLKTDKTTAITETLKEVGLTTLLTSVTTAIGFLSLITSKLQPIKDFGLNSAIGVMVAYIVVIFFTSALLLIIPKKHLLSTKNSIKSWNIYLLKINVFTKKNPKRILYSAAIFTAICYWGVSKINTNYEFQASFPKNSVLADDFSFFQTKYSGFRPLEVAILAQGENKITDFKILQEIDKMENKLKTFKDIREVTSVNLLFKGINKAHHLNKKEFFTLPKEEKTYNLYNRDIKKVARKQLQKFVNVDNSKGRISAKVLDIGTDSLIKVYEDLNHFITTKTDSSLVRFRLTGKGMLLDKNSVYIRNSLLQGLGIGLILVGIIMVILFKDIKLLIISLVPNILPLLFAGALLGFLEIPLEATISIVFAIVFGIAVDDTIHFLGRYKLCRFKGLSKEEAIEKTFKETGRALIITTLLLFFGFMVLVFSIHLPSITIGLLLSATLLTALILDLLLLPVLIRKWIKE
ncbi:MMPL family transporter [uncultured Maribacter sp.]|uniref:efflux RND transporter permease subunit n=1 Tax=uncultured Maribacter sp. TaxID=431308 RepID=UPI00262ED939|nr:MMPL family transporter [uncultured Maribacter sp.]